jgi:hypothetical protein
MSYIIPNEGDNHIMSAAFNASGYMYLDLFSNDATLTATMKLRAHYKAYAGGYTSAWAFTGIPVHQTAWKGPYLTAGSAECSASGQASNGGFLFAFSAAPNQSAYGYVVSNDNAKCIVVEKFASVYYLANAGDTITITPKVRAT